MTKTTYSEKLQSPLWQKKRLEILSRDNFTCQLCKDETSTLHVHHKSYKKGKEPWDYDNGNFITYCKVCHSLIEYSKGKEINILSVAIKSEFLSHHMLGAVVVGKNFHGIRFIFFEYNNSNSEISVSVAIRKEGLIKCLYGIESLENENPNLLQHG